MKKNIYCDICKGGTKLLTYPEGHHLICPYCKDTGKREIDIPDSTHKMSEWRTEIRSPCGTGRFYNVRECKICGEEELQHPAGHFFNNLLSKCKPEDFNY
ncbi:MAG: hypothetical protein ABIC57_01375 [bacterium]